MDSPGGAAGGDSQPLAGNSGRRWTGVASLRKILSIPWEISMSSPKILFYTLLSLLFKAEALSVFYVGWIDALVSETNAESVTMHRNVAFIWLSKPLLSLFNDWLSRCFWTLDDFKELILILSGRRLVEALLRKLLKRQKKMEEYSIFGHKLDLENEPIFKYYRQTSQDSVSDEKVDTGKYNASIVVLVIAELIMMFYSIAIYVAYLVGEFDKPWIDTATIIFTICVVYTSSCADGLFSRHLRHRSEGIYAKAISARLALHASYAVSIALCVVLPNTLPFVTDMFNTNILFPIFIISNGVCTLWLLYDPTDLQLKTYSSSGAERKRVSPSPLPTPTATSLPETPRDGIISFPTECLISLVTLLFISMLIKNRYIAEGEIGIKKEWIFLIKE
ncbi:hypothetical protein BEWA_050020 [Theileria equi strain WA]|uniref:Uncharacterized protein n=1 Tax=Theileria equi strain WA TaxID=1537102 RepID=L1LB87_THEEQ|nr:hypothetical protein BEWA_050020 [Theileria equi strain WA]EKX72534.1 hypothetical protein BEWA_050020 [Theileria equi strain WA]|eukprot:XP_004831986.1 hypothetical protein BEWA_050020 [Theileria equi strain WA]